MTTSAQEASRRIEIVELGRALYDRGITPGRTGNLSCAVGGGFLMTPTGVSLGRLRAESLAFMDSAGTVVSGDPPSKEWALHRACYARDPGIGAVAHVHSTNAVAVSLLADLDPEDVLPPLTAYYVMRVGSLPLVPYVPPGDAGLATAIAGLDAGVRCALLANHGPIAAAADLEAAVDAVEEIEETATLHLLLRGERIRPLTPAQVRATGHVSAVRSR